MWKVPIKDMKAWTCVEGRDEWRSVMASYSKTEISAGKKSLWIPLLGGFWSESTLCAERGGNWTSLRTSYNSCRIRIIYN